MIGEKSSDDEDIIGFLYIFTLWQFLWIGLGDRLKLKIDEAH